MHYKTINTAEAVDLFHQLMQPGSRTRIMYLAGDGKMGKSHLLTKIFPHFAQQDYQARCAILDLGYHFLSVPDILNQACAQFDDQCCDDYYAADQAWINRPKVDVKGLTTTFSRVGIFAKDGVDEARDKARSLTNAFARDVSKCNDKALLLLFDSVERASEEIRNWLTEMLLVPLSRLGHVRMVLAGRSLPQPHGSYRVLCQDYQLLPVKDMQAYIEFCQNSNLTLPEQSIPILAQAFDYIPGLFAEVLSKFTLRG
jgi:hypothetical protein